MPQSPVSNMLVERGDEAGLARAVATGRFCRGYGDQSDEEYEHFRLVAGHHPPISLHDSSHPVPPRDSLGYPYSCGARDGLQGQRNQQQGCLGIPSDGNYYCHDDHEDGNNTDGTDGNCVVDDIEERQAGRGGEDNVRSELQNAGHILVQRHRHGQGGCAQGEDGDRRTFHVSTLGSVTLRELSPQQAGLGCSVWPSAVVLAAYIAEHPSIFGGHKTVLELGAGVGLPLFVAAGLEPPPAQVTHSDLSELLKTNAERNIAANAGSLLCKDMRAEVVQWDEYAYGKARPAGPGYDVVLGADVVYNPANAITLLHAVLANLREGGLLCLCSPSPSELRPGYDSLLEGLRKAGTVHLVPVTLLHLHEPQAAGTKIRKGAVDCLRRFCIVLFWKNILALPPCD